MIAIAGLSTQVATYLTPEMIFAHTISAAGYLTARDSSQAPEKRLTTVYTNLLPVAQGNYADAEPLYTRSLAVREKVLGPEHPDVAFSLNGLAALLDSQVKISFDRNTEYSGNGCSALSGTILHGFVGCSRR